MKRKYFITALILIPFLLGVVSSVAELQKKDKTITYIILVLYVISICFLRLKYLKLSFKDYFKSLIGINLWVLFKKDND